MVIDIYRMTTGCFFYMNNFLIRCLTGYIIALIEGLYFVMVDNTPNEALVSIAFRACHGLQEKNCATCTRLQLGANQ